MPSRKRTSRRRMSQSKRYSKKRNVFRAAGFNPKVTEAIRLIVDERNHEIVMQAIEALQDPYKTILSKLYLEVRRDDIAWYQIIKNLTNGEFLEANVRLQILARENATFYEKQEEKLRKSAVFSELLDRALSSYEINETEMVLE